MSYHQKYMIFFKNPKWNIERYCVCSYMYFRLLIHVIVFVRGIFFLDWEDSIKTASNNVNEGPTDNNVDGSQTKGNFLKDVNSLFEFFLFV